MQSTTYRQPGLRMTEHTLSVPLDHARPDGERIDVFARAVVLAEKVDAEQPWLLFLQGGPGFEGPRPTAPESPSWLRRALADYRVLLLDQLIPIFHASTLWLIGAGGVVYSLGVIFHVWRGLRFQNAIWHAFVLAAASIHYAAVWSTVAAVS